MKDHDYLGTKNIGIGGMPNESRTDINETRKLVETSNAFAEKINKYGFKFTYCTTAF